MPAHLLVAGLDARSLQLEAPLLRRERHVVDERGTFRELMEDIPRLGTRLVVLGPRLPDAALADAIRRIRGVPATRGVSLLVLLPSEEPEGAEAEALEAGANAALRRPLDRARLETWLAKLLIVPRRVDARIPVQGHVVGTPRSSEAVHFFGLTRNLSVNGMLLASPVPLPATPDLDLEFNIPGVIARLQALGRVVREAGEVEWPYLGYGVEFLFVPPDSQEALAMLVSGSLPLPPAPAADQTLGIHSTLRRKDWVYEILEPVRQENGWQAEIRRAPRHSWRPGLSGPFYVVEGRSRESVLKEARAFLARHPHPAL
jgi:CheY-like chemotaxis protein